ncbi:MAG: glycoside hydrolase family 57 [Proteobacteria bacterium]|nr:glycoside hydrolase family 57 [Pseudomonadota bacterium]
MNAPFLQREAIAAGGTLHLYAAFHLNLAFSSIEEEQRGEVIKRCYWPLLDLACKHGPIGIEATGFTLEEILARDPEWIGRLRSLIARGRVELIGSGYAQIIGPLVPARVTEENLKIGNEIYQRLLRAKPTLALVNEQAYSAGLVELYRDAGYRAVLMDWDNPGVQHPEWPSETRYLPQRAKGVSGESIGLLWTSTVAFQKLQRFVHGDIALEEYLEHTRSRRGRDARALCVYASDGEIFDFRPGRYRTEETLSDSSEWKRLNEAFAALRNEANMRLMLPSEALELNGLADADQALHLQSAECPVPVKKQRKYNLSRWAVTGRDDIAVNAACQRIYEALAASNAGSGAWKELCGLWASDFRTHITQKRWAKFCEQLKAAEARFCIAPSPSPPPHPALSPCGGEGERFILVETPTLSARLDRRRGLAIESLRFAGHEQAAVGGLPHGHFDDIALQADWYTGDCVFEAPGEHKITDLEWCEARVWTEANGDVVACAKIETAKGPIEKTLRFLANAPRVEFDIVFHWQDWGRGSLRLGHITLLPDAFEWTKLSLTTHNGGKEAETFSLNGATVEHGAPVSFLVSSSFGLGMTEGWAELGDTKTRVRVDVDRKTAPLLGLLTHKRIGGSLFCQLMLSALELDETRKPAPYCDGARRFRFGISAAAKSTDH